VSYSKADSSETGALLGRKILAKGSKFALLGIDGFIRYLESLKAKGSPVCRGDGLPNGLAGARKGLRKIFEGGDAK
jgi:hypothetical protein